MRKQTKLVAVLSAAALLAIGASMTSFAATGWTEEDGTWVYYDKEGYKVTDTWKKSGSYWYYLDEDGYMATEKLIENSDDYNNIYYVDETGRMVTNAWKELENPDFYDGADDDEETETVYYYFQNSGKAYKANDGHSGDDTTFKTINGKKYAFDENGHMQWGWLDEDLKHVPTDEAYKTGYYYCGDPNDGARVTNDWRNLYISQPDVDSEDDYYWFYFGTNGKKYYYDGTDEATLKANQKSGKKINGKYYTFDEHGVMQSSWYDTISTDTDGMGIASEYEGYFSTDEDGARRKGWFEVVPSKLQDSEANSNDEAKWFYANSDGSVVTSMIKSINGKKYAFNVNGEMLYGLWLLEVDPKTNVIVDAVEAYDTEAEVENIQSVETAENQAFYYFGTSDDGAMKTGSQNIDVEGIKYQFNFGKTGADKGKGIDKVLNNVLYVNGKRVKADSDYRYQIVDGNGNVQVLTGEGQTADGYLINTSGTIMKGTSRYTDTDGKQYTVAKNDNGTYKITFLQWKQ